MKSGMDLSVVAVVVTYNRKELLKECLLALFNQTYPNLNIIVIDNASTDGTREYIKEFIESSDIQYYNMKKNIGGAGGFNKGISLAVKKCYDYIWLMDDDTIPMNDSLEKLMDAAQTVDYNFGFLSSYAQFIDGSPCIINIPELKIERWIYYKKFIQDGLIDVERATFVSFLIPRRVVLQEGLPIKEFFIWADDTEYSRRISKDFPCYFVNDSVVIHKVKSNVGVGDDDFVNSDIERLRRYRYRYRNRFYVAKKGRLREIWDYCGEFLALNLKLLHARDHKIKRLAVLWQGFISGIFFNPSIEYINEEGTKI